MLRLPMLSPKPRRSIRREVVTVYSCHERNAHAVEMDCGHVAPVATVAKVRERHECQDCTGLEAVRQLLADYLPARA